MSSRNPTPVCPKTQQKCTAPCKHAPREDDRRETNCLGLLILKCERPETLA